MSLDCYRYLADVLHHGMAVLATVTAVRGSVPREVGAKMVICGDGQTFNTIGGGAGEAKVIRQARAVLETGQKQFVEINLTGTTRADRSTSFPTEGICGGTMQVWLERWTDENGASKGAIGLIQRILQQLESGQPVTLVTPFDANPPYIADAPVPHSTHAFIETLYPPPMLLIVGAGHVGIQLAAVAAQIGFQVAVQDDRPEWANSQRYPQASQIFTEPIAATVTQLVQQTQLYAALVTRGYQHDLAALTALLQRDPPCRYIGMIGSERRVKQVFQAIEAAGIPVEALRSVYAPIGLDIGALTPEEIAISIGAELIMVRRGGTGRPLSEATHCHKPEPQPPADPLLPQKPESK
ncbi:xanthine dehydrogenase [filamentous cyanobacterium CCP2]|nr:xanthine dehydrogenase [filamentous cyanobacterium CCP2]